MSGSILEYRGQEAYWAALCAMEGIQASDDLPNPDDADAEIDAIWDFVVDNCLDLEIEIPSKIEATGHLRVLMVEYLEEMSE